MELTPEFDSDIKEYSATTENATNTVSATPEDENAEITVVFKGQEKESGAQLTWDEGENEVTVNVKNEEAEETYTIVVTKETEHEPEDEGNGDTEGQEENPDNQGGGSEN